MGAEHVEAHQLPREREDELHVAVSHVLALDPDQREVEPLDEADFRQPGSAFG